MNSPKSKFPWTLGLGLLLILATLGAVFLFSELDSRGARGEAPAVYGQVADFTLTNELGSPVSLAALQGRVWVADIIFTRCAGPCLKMTKQMAELQAALPPESQARLVTLSTDPDYDTPPVLAKYAQRFGADTNRWMFLTGTRAAISGLASSSLKLSAVAVKPQEQQSASDLFVHSTIFVVVDKRGQLRGIFQTEGEDVDWSKSKKDILAAVSRLEREP